jgi:hypothetical protein
MAKDNGKKKEPKAPRKAKDPSSPKKESLRSKLGAAGAFAVRMDKVGVLLEKAEKRLSKWKCPGEGGEDLAATAYTALTDALVAVRSVSDTLRSIPKSWAPAGAVLRGAKAIFEGSQVMVSEKAATKYADSFTNGEGKALTVERVGTMVRCRTKDGMVIMLKRSDVVPVTA